MSARSVPLPGRPRRHRQIDPVPAAGRLAARRGPDVVAVRRSRRHRRRRRHPRDCCWSTAARWPWPARRCCSWPAAPSSSPRSSAPPSTPAQVVVSDRFLLANVVYQGHAGGLDAGAAVGRGPALHRRAGAGPDRRPRPAARGGAARRGRPADRMESRAADYHVRVREGFLAEARRRPERIVVVDAAPPVEAVHAAQSVRR